MIGTMKKNFLEKYDYFFDANGNLNMHCDEEESEEISRVVQKNKT